MRAHNMSDGEAALAGGDMSDGEAALAGGEQGRSKQQKTGDRRHERRSRGDKETVAAGQK